MARTIDPVQLNSTIVLMVKEKDLWTEVRKFCIDNSIPLSQFVHDAVNTHLEKLKVHAEAIANVRAANS